MKFSFIKILPQILKMLKHLQENFQGQESAYRVFSLCHSDTSAHLIVGAGGTAFARAPLLTVPWFPVGCAVSCSFCSFVDCCYQLLKALMAWWRWLALEVFNGRKSLLRILKSEVWLEKSNYKDILAKEKYFSLTKPKWSQDAKIIALSHHKVVHMLLV